uniref:Reverse transcriptase domain-containing protein n=1 Tax=Neogobius melanostomus TaxID=47308 RepID=A0A8C6WRQ5_9GOBI
MFKSDLFPVRVGLRQGCPLSPVLFITFMDRISRRSQGPEGAWSHETKTVTKFHVFSVRTCEIRCNHFT